MDAVYEFMDRSRMFRRGGYVLCWFLVLKAAWWVAGYAEAALAQGASGADTAMIIAAVLTPLSGLAAMVFKAYSDGRVNDGPNKSQSGAA
jgi:hypothetical protein